MPQPSYSLTVTFPCGCTLTPRDEPCLHGASVITGTPVLDRKLTGRHLYLVEPPRPPETP